MRRFILSFGAVLCVCFGCTCLAQQPTKVSLEQALDLAVSHSHTLKAAQSQVPQNEAAEITANLRPNPVIAWDTQFLPLFQPTEFNASYIDSQAQFDLGIGYLFERGNKRQHRLRAARDTTAVSRYQVADAERSLQFEVAQAFVNVLLAESTLQFAQEALKSYQQTVDISNERFRAGDISEGDLLKVKLQLLQFQTDVSSANMARVQGLASLRQLMGYDSVPDNYDVDGTLNYEPLNVNLDDLKAEALRQRPDLLAATAGVTAASSQHDLAVANGKRDLNTTFNYSRLGGVNSGSFFFNMELPIFDRNQGEKKRTLIAIDQAKQTALAASDAVLTDVTDAYYEMQSANEIVKLYVGGYLDQAKESRDISEYAFQHGAASLLDLLDAERSYRETELNYRQTLASYMTAVEQLKEAVGTRRLP